MGLFFLGDRAGQDMVLCDHHASGISGGRPVHVGIRVFYNAAQQTVYVENSGPNGVTTKSYKIPKKVRKTRSGLIKYLETQDVYMPSM